MSFNWWKRHEAKPQIKSRFPIKVKIEQTPEVTQGVGTSSGDVKTAYADNPAKGSPGCLWKEEVKNGCPEKHQTFQ